MVNRGHVSTSWGRGPCPVWPMIPVTLGEELHVELGERNFHLTSIKPPRDLHIYLLT
jgi:hypothetical protein